MKIILKQYIDKNLNIIDIPILRLNENAILIISFNGSLETLLLKSLTSINAIKRDNKSSHNLSSNLSKESTQ